MAADGLGFGSVSDRGLTPGKKDATEKFMGTEAREDPETVSRDNPLEAWFGKKGKPSPPFGKKGHNF